MLALGIVAGGAAVVAVLIVSLFLNQLVRLRISTAVNLVQGFLPPFVNSLSASLLWAIASAPKTVVDSRSQFRQPAMWLASTVLLLQVVAGLWSSDLSIWRIRVLQTFVFWLVLLLALETKARAASPMKLVLVASIPLVVCQALSVIVFRVFPAIESSYLRSNWAGFLLGSSVSSLYTDNPNNVLDIAKSGGLMFLNANVASMMLGMYLMGYLWLWFSARSYLSLTFAVIAGVAALFTGSKTAFVLLACLGTFVALSGLLVRNRRPWLFLCVASVVAVGGAVGASLFLAKNDSGIASQTETTWGIRVKLWEAAADFFVSNPFLGMGFGGWAEKAQPLLADVGLKQVFPPHNFLIAMWAESGILTVLAVLALFGLFFVAGVSQIRKADRRIEGMALACVLAVVAWAVLHGMADNTTFFGVVQTAALAAAAIAHVSGNQLSPTPDLELRHTLRRLLPRPAKRANRDLEPLER